MAKLLFLNGPNLNLLGQREPHHYGRDSLTSIEAQLKQLAPKHQLNFFQSNHEGALVDQIQQAKDRYDFILINPGAFGHTSIALRDAFLAVEIPFIELHLSNIYAREDFRHQTFLSDIAVGIIIGFGAKGYELALLAALDFLTKNQ